MNEKKLLTILEALADKIDNLELGIYIKDISYNNLKEENERLRKENEDLKEQVQYFIDALKCEEDEKNA
jgi:hypothetical protein